MPSILLVFVVGSNLGFAFGLAFWWVILFASRERRPSDDAKRYHTIRSSGGITRMRRVK